MSEWKPPYLMTFGKYIRWNITAVPNNYLEWVAVNKKFKWFWPRAQEELSRRHKEGIFVREEK